MGAQKEVDRVNETTERMLVVIDVINGFIREGALSDRGIERIIPPIVRMVGAAAEREDVIVAFCDCHTKDSPELQSFPPHCLAGTRESKLVEELLPFENDMTIFPKNSTNGFLVPEFGALLKTMTVLKEVTVVGCCTDICILNFSVVLKNYFNEIGREVEVTVPMEAVETFDLPGHPRDKFNEMAVTLMKQAGVRVTGLGEE